QVPFAKVIGTTGFQFYFDLPNDNIWFGGNCAGIGWRYAKIAYVQETALWHHLVGRLTGSTLSIFLDNVQGIDEVTAGPFNPSTCNLTIGNRNFYFTKTWWWGVIDQAVFYNTVLDIPTIQRHSARRYSL
ncbi:unnamed protein product, partial [marine sediment metagenome]